MRFHRCSESDIRAAHCWQFLVAPLSVPCSCALGSRKVSKKIPSLYLNQIHVLRDLRMHIAVAYALNPQYLSTTLLLSLLNRSQPQYSQPLHNTAEPSRVFDYWFLAPLISCLLPVRSFAISSATLPTLCIVQPLHHLHH